MPIEIRELVIRATVEQSNRSGNNRPEAQGNGARDGRKTLNELSEQIAELSKIIRGKNER